MVIGVFRTTQFALQNFSRNVWLSVVTIFLLVLTLLSITLVVGLNIVGHEMIQAIEERVDLDLYFSLDVSEADIFAVSEFLEQMPEVTSVVYVSQEDALEKFRTEHADDPDILASLDELEDNVLPASLIVRTRQIEDYPKVLDRFQASEYQALVDRTAYRDNQDIIAKITQVTTRAYQFGLGASIVFIVISVIVIFNTIRITIYSHREEVGIMKLVGATNWFIRAPFILESIFLGCIAAAIIIVFFGGLLFLSDPALSSFFEGYHFSLLRYVQDHLFTFVISEFFGAVLLSIISSMVAITRYLKV